MFDGKSRYLTAPTYVVTDRRGRQVVAVSAPACIERPSLGIHVRREGERIDHLASRYLSDPAGFWRIADHNHVMIVEALSEAPEIDIPRA
jgi:hypothetical protein